MINYPNENTFKITNEERLRSDLQLYFAEEFNQILGRIGVPFFLPGVNVEPIYYCRVSFDKVAKFTLVDSYNVTGDPFYIEYRYEGLISDS